MSKFDVDSFLKERREKERLKKNNTKANDSKRTFDADKFLHERTIGFDTFSDDLNTMNTTLSGIYGGWQDADTMAKTRDSVSSFYNRLSAYEDYRKNYGTEEDELPDLSELMGFYKTSLDDWDNLTTTYGQYKSADEFNKAVKAFGESEAQNKKMRGANLLEENSELAYMESNLRTAKAKKAEADSKENAYTDAMDSNDYTDTTRSKGRSGKSRKNNRDFISYMNSIGYSSIEELESAIADKKTFIDQATVLQNEQKALKSEDFEQYSNIGANVENPSYDESEHDFAIFGHKFGGEEVKNKIKFAKEHLTGYASANAPDAPNSPVPVSYIWANEDEQKVYEYYLGLEMEGKVEKGTAQKYLDSIEGRLKDRHETQIITNLDDLAGGGFWAKAGASALSVPYSFTGAIEHVKDSVEYGKTGTMDDNFYARASSTIRSRVAEDVDWNVDLGIIKGDAFDFLYNTTMSGVDSLAATAAYGSLGGVSLGLSAAASATNDALDRGFTDEQALKQGFMSGAFEMLFESISIGRFLNEDVSKGYLRNLATSMFVNASEEMATELANIAYDTFANGDLSNYQVRIQELVDSGKTPEEARRIVSKEFAGQVLEAGASGAVMGSGFTTINAAKYGAYTNSLGKAIRNNENVGNVVDLASVQFSPEEKSAYDAYTRYANKGINAENIKNGKLGNLAHSLGADAEAVLDSKNSTPEERAKAKRILQDLDAYIEGTKVSDFSSDVKDAYKDKDSVKALIQSGLEGDKDSESYKLAKEYRAKLIGGKKLSDKEISKLSDLIAKDEFTKASPGNIRSDALTEELRLKARAGENSSNAELMEYAEGINESDKQLFIDTYDGKMPLDEYAKAFTTVNDFAKENAGGKNTQDVLLENNAGLTPAQIAKIYGAAVVAPRLAQQKAIDKLVDARKGKLTYKANVDDSVIDYDNKGTAGKVNWNSLTSKQKAAITFVKGFAKGMGLNLKFVSNGIKREFEGKYKRSGNTIYIDIEAGIEDVYGFLTTDTIINTAGHEVTHWAKLKAIALYSNLADKVFAVLTKDTGLTEFELIANEQARLKEELGKDYSAEYARDEIIARACEDIITMSEEGKKMFYSLSESEQKSLVDKIKAIINDAITWINDLLGLYKSDSEEATILRKYREELQDIVKTWDEMIVSAREANAALEAEGINEAEVVKGLAEVHDVQLNERLVEKHFDLLDKNYSEESVLSLEEIKNRYNKVIDIWQSLGGEINSEFLKDWNEKLGTDRVFEVFKAQSGYKYNVELSSMCKKGIPLFEAIDRIVKSEAMKQLTNKTLGKAEKEVLYDILKSEGFDIPCAICYVEQARQREGVIIDAFLDGKVDKSKTGKVTKVKLGWNEVLSKVQDRMKEEYGVDYKFPKLDRSVATDKYTPADINMDIETQEAFYNALKDIANEEITRYNEAEKKNKKLITEVTPSAIKEAFKGNISANFKIFRDLFNDPTSRFMVDNDLLYSSMTTQNIAKYHNTFYTLFNSQYGVNGYKSKQGAVIYWADILNKKWIPSDLRKEGGIRNQSNSDFMMYTFLDHAQMYIDFTAKGYYLQAYTKVLAELKLFGLSNGKINASTIPKVVVYENEDGTVDEEKTKLYAGLDENGNLAFDDIEGINHKEAFMLAEDSEYSKSIGLVCIGYSDNHILKLLDDRRIQQIIGFHDKTNDGKKRYRGARYATNYNGYNEATKKGADIESEVDTDSDSGKKTKHINYNGFIRKAENKFNGKTEGTVEFNGKVYGWNDVPKLAADMYIAECEKKGLDPAYSKCGIDFSKHPNYYKLLADFSLYDSNGNYCPHSKVEFNLPSQVPYLDANGNKAYMDTKAYIKQELEGELKVRDDISAKLGDTSENGIISKWVNKCNEMYEEDEQLSHGKARKRPPLHVQTNMTKAELLRFIADKYNVMPSTSATNKPVSKFGEITAVLKNLRYADPRFTPGTTIFPDDAWTPQQGRLRPNPVFDDEKVAAFVNDIKDTLRKYGAEELFDMDVESFKKKFAVGIGNIFDKDFRDNLGLRTAYALTKGDVTPNGEKPLIDSIPFKNDGTIDEGALHQEIEEKLAKHDPWRAFRLWLEAQAGTEETQGFVIAHDEVTPDDILASMRRQDKSTKFFSLTADGYLNVPVQELNSLEEMQNMRGKLSANSERANSNLANEMLEFVEKISKVKSVEFDEALKFFNKGWEHRGDIAELRQLSKKMLGSYLSAETTEKLDNFYKAAIELPALYGEVKPNEKISVNEFAYFIPSYEAEELIPILEENGCEYIVFEATGDVKADLGSRQSAITAYLKDHPELMLNTYEENLKKESDEDSKTTANEDEQFQRRNQAPTAHDLMGEGNRLQQEYDMLNEDVAKLKAVVGTNEVPNKRFLSLARYLIKNTGVTMDTVEVANKLKDAYTMIQESDSLKWSDITRAIQDVVESVSNKDLKVPTTYFKNIMADIRKDNISLNTEQRAAMEARFGGYGEFHKAVFGRANVSNAGTPLTEVYQKWAEKYPAVFDPDAQGVDQVNALVDAVNTLKETSNLMGEYEKAEAVRHLSTEVYNQLWNIAAEASGESAKALKQEHAELMKKLRSEYEARQSQSAVHPSGETALKYEQALRRVAEKNRKKVAEAKAHGREKLAQYKENAERRVKIQSITNNSLNLGKKLLKNSQEEHIHEALKAPVINLLNAIDFSSKRMVNEGIPTNKDISLAKSLGQIKDMMVKASNGHADFVQLYGHGLDDKIEAMMMNIDAMDRAVADNEYILQKMSLEDLDTLDKMVKTIKTAVNKLNQFHVAQHKEGIASLSRVSVRDMESLGKGKVYDGLKGRINKTLMWNNALPVYAFERFGEGGKIIFRAIQDGWDKFAFNVKKALDFAEGAYTSKEAQEWEKDVKTFNIRVPFSESEKADPDYQPEYQKVQMTVPQIMSLYCLTKRDQAKGHILGGGIRVADFTIENKRKKEVITQEKGAVFSSEDIDKIVETLTPRQKAVADKLQEFMNTVCTEWGNEVSMARFGYKAFGEENYFPIKSDDNNISKEPNDAETSLFRLLNMSFTKSLTKNANNRVIISNIFDVFAQHASDMAKYNSLALPVLDAFQWYNYTEKQDVGDNGAFKTQGVKQEMESAFGKAAQNYFTTFLKDINGQKEVSRDTVGKGFFTNAKIAAVGANLRVVSHQPTSYLRASAVIDNKYLAAAFAHKPKIDKAEKYCGIALWKSMGYYDTNIQRGVTEQIKHTETWKDKAAELSMKGAEAADKVTWGYLWNACELEIRDTRKDLKVGSEEFYNAIADRLREVIYKTQVVDSTLTRSQIMRSGDGYDKLLTSFASEPTLSYNMLMEAFNQVSLDTRKMGRAASWKKNGKYVARTLAAYTVTNAVAALVESAFDAFRDTDDDDDKDLVYFMKLYFSNFSQDMSVIGKIPYIKEITSLIRGFSGSRTDTQWMESLVKTATEWGKIATTDKGNPAKAIKESIRTISYMSGLPFYNAYRDFMAGLDMVNILEAEDLEEMLKDIFE